jgi:hypothetical protein
MAFRFTAAAFFTALAFAAGAQFGKLVKAAGIKAAAGS